MIRLLQSTWMTALIGSMLYLGVTILSFPSAGALRKSLPASTEPHALIRAEASWNFRNPELDQMIRELAQEKESLATREQQVREMEARLQAERAEITAVTQAVARLQKEFDQNVIRLKDNEMPNLKRLAKSHAAMSPDGAANILKELTDVEIVKILACLKPDESGPILEAFGRLGKDEARRTALLSERLRNTLPATPGGK
jgi:flagellar motility protein MotE (MotC chaperone)